MFVGSLRRAGVWFALLSSLMYGSVAFAAAPGFATGIKIGEVDADSARVWVRLTRDAQRVPMGSPMPVITYSHEKTGKPIQPKDRDRQAVPKVHLPEGVTVEQLEGAAPGMSGEARVRYRREGDAAWLETGWQAVDSTRDYTTQFALESLDAASKYEVEVDARAGTVMGEQLTGGFRTAPASDSEAPVSFTVISCTDYPDRDLPGEGFKIYPAMRKLDPAFFVHTGDILYYDQLAKSLELARWHWQQVYSLPTNLAFHREVAGYFMKDDHDTWVNDCWPGMPSRFMGEFTFEQGLGVFREQVPMGDKNYRTVRWGKHLQIWMVEGRDFRSANTDADGPAKSIWGEEQKRWFKETVSASDATFRVLLTPTPVVGPDRDSKGDNHANRAFAHEGRELRRFMAEQKNMVVLCGDRHWQYVSVDPETGLREYGCGAGSNEHAGGWPKDLKRDEQLYVNVIGGFLHVSVETDGGAPVMRLAHRGVEGEVLHTETLLSNAQGIAVQP